MKLTKSTWAILAAGILSIYTAAQPAGAAITTIFDRDDSSTFMNVYPNSQAAFNTFTASLGSFGLSTIDAATPGLNPVLSFPTTPVTATTQGVLANNNIGFQIGTQSLVEADAAIANFPAVDSEFTFSHYLTAFGLYVTQSGDGANSNLLRFRLTNTVANTFVDVPVQAGPGWGLDNVFFFGITDTTPFNRVTIIEDGPTGDLGDGSLYDNIVIRHIPEPSSLALMSIGACLVGRLRRRR